MSEYIVDVGNADEEYIAYFGQMAEKLMGNPIREEIVRCRDCRFSYEDELGNLRCQGPLIEPWDYYNDEPSDGVKIEPKGFCAWGERKDGGDD